MIHVDPDVIDRIAQQRPGKPMDAIAAAIGRDLKPGLSRDLPMRPSRMVPSCARKPTGKEYHS